MDLQQTKKRSIKSGGPISTMNGRLVRLEEFDQFRSVLRHAPEDVDDAVLVSVRDLDERTEFEPALRSVLTDVGDTPHGPAETVDILTHKLTLNRKSGVAAFILKGKSFPKGRRNNKFSFCHMGSMV